MMQKNCPTDPMLYAIIVAIFDHTLDMWLSYPAADLVLIMEAATLKLSMTAEMHCYRIETNLGPLTYPSCRRDYLFCP